MENHRPESSDEQLEHHSLPGTNMAGKKAANECEPADKQAGASDEDGDATRRDNSTRKEARKD